MLTVALLLSAMHAYIHVCVCVCVCILCIVTWVKSVKNSNTPARTFLIYMPWLHSFLFFSFLFSSLSHGKCGGSFLNKYFVAINVAS